MCVLTVIVFNCYLLWSSISHTQIRAISSTCEKSEAEFFRRITNTPSIFDSQMEFLKAALGLPNDHLFTYERIKFQGTGNIWLAVLRNVLNTNPHHFKGTKEEKRDDVIDFNLENVTILSRNSSVLTSSCRAVIHSLFREQTTRLIFKTGSSLMKEQGLV